MFFALIADIMLTCADRCTDADMHEEFRGMLGLPIGTLHGLLGFSDRLLKCVRRVQLVNPPLP